MLGFLCVENVHRVSWKICEGFWVLIYRNYLAFSTRRFDIKQHIIECPSNYRGRQVTEATVQEYISNIITKYLPSTLPPWQICIIPIVPTNATRSETSISEAESETTTATTPMPDTNQQSLSECSTVTFECTTFIRQQIHDV